MDVWIFTIYFFFHDPLRHFCLLAALLEPATASKMLSTDSWKLAALKQSSCLIVPNIQEPVSRTQMQPKGKNTSTGSADRILKHFLKQNHKI